MSTFYHDLFPVCALDRIDTPQGRFYNVPTDKGFVPYPSVTNVIGNYYDNSWLEAWKKRVGEEAAAKASAQAKNRGTAMHSLYENYLLNKLDLRRVMPINLADFKKMQPILNDITTVHGVELPLFSHKLKMAGTTDAVVRWGKVPSVVDFKTSKKVKKISDITHYFVQGTIYSIMIEEMYGLKIDQVVILMTVDHEDPLVFIEKTETYLPEVEKIRASIN